MASKNGNTDVMGSLATVLVIVAASWICNASSSMPAAGIHFVFEQTCYQMKQ